SAPATNETREELIPHPPRRMRDNSPNETCLRSAANAEIDSRYANRPPGPGVVVPAIVVAVRPMAVSIARTMGATLVYPHFFIVACFLDLPVLDNELNGGIALNDGRRASEHCHCTGLRPECAKSEGTQHDAHSCRSEVFPDQISVPFMGKRIAAKFKPSG